MRDTMPSSLYHQVQTEDRDEEKLLASKSGTILNRFPPQSRGPNVATKGLIAGLLMTNIILLVFIFSGRLSANRLNSQILYSPAQDAIEYEVKKFNSGFSTQSIYQQKPSPEVDKAWLDQYDSFGMSRLPKATAALLPNKTYPYPDDEGYYVALLAVFHNLHCLNELRKALFPEHYGRNATSDDYWEHTSHCIEELRQSITCASDISVIVWQWENKADKVLAHEDIVHSCRRFDKIQDWAKENTPRIPFDHHKYVEDDIVIPEF